MSHSLLSSYSRHPLRYDELIGNDGLVRPHWHNLFAHLENSPPELMQERVDFVQRRMQENGVTYNVYADPNGADRPWMLDPLPFILPNAEWKEIEAAVAQRARVINATLADIYGEQRLLAEGLLPPALVFGQHGYLAPCQGVKPPGGVFLHSYAADLARSPDGRWWVIADRTQSPAGAGYALENRIVISRVFPELFRDMKVQHLAYFFHALQESLAHWAPVSEGEQPHIVLLTPGPYNETYFEHAYLARYLGFPLVEGQDLTVRGDTVYLKTVSGLKRVHVILRRQDDSFCDPLELNGSSTLGIPGLVQAVRAKRVLVANALGSGLMGSVAMMGFLPGIARRLLSEELAMPSVATWWCGEKPALDYALKHLDDLVIKPTYPTQSMEPVFGKDLQGEARLEMLRRLQTRPHAYVAQEMVNLSRAPMWNSQDNKRMLARGMGLRVYAVATPNGYVIMPGGLTRVASGTKANLISMKRGGSSKDTWVLADDGQVNTLTLLKQAISSKDVIRSGSNLTSRVVENLYWLGRYSERFDDTARLLRVALTRLMDAGGEMTSELQAIVQLCEDMFILPPVETEAEATSPTASTKDGEAAKATDTDAGASTPETLETRLLNAIYSQKISSSLAANIRSVLWCATQVRERLSLDHWHSLNRLQRETQTRPEQQRTLSEALIFLDRVLSVSSSLNGFAMDNMTRDNGWRFLIIARRIERMDFLANAIAKFLRSPHLSGAEDLEWLLELADSIITYRSRYLRQPELLPVLDLIVFDDANPHAVVFQMQVVQRYLERLGKELLEERDSSMSLAIEQLQDMDLDEFCGINLGTDDCREPSERMAARLEAVSKAAEALSDRIANRYFTHVNDYSQQTLAT